MKKCQSLQSLKILIIGGGPIGLYQAIELAEAGHQVDLVEAGKWPRDKVCGEGLMPAGVALLDQMGVLKHLEADAFAPFRGVRYLDGERQSTGYFKEGIGLGVRRTELSRALYTRAKEISSISLYENTTLSGLGNLAGPPVTAQFRGGIQSWCGDFIIGADGVNSKTRKLLEVKSVSLSSHERLGGRLHLKSDQVPSEVEVYWADGVEAYLTPNSKDSLEIAFLWFKKSYTGAASNLEDWLWNQFPGLKARYHHCERLSQFQTQGGFARRAESLCGRNWALVGDAAYFFDGITGEGLSLGFGLARTLAWALTEGDLEAYRAQAKKLIRHNIYLTKLALTLARKPRLRPLAMRFLSDRLMSGLVNLAADLALEPRPASELFKSALKRHNEGELHYSG